MREARGGARVSESRRVRADCVGALCSRYRRWVKASFDDGFTLRGITTSLSFPLHPVLPHTPREPPTGGNTQIPLDGLDRKKEHRQVSGLTWDDVRPSGVDQGYVDGIT